MPTLLPRAAALMLAVSIPLLAGAQAVDLAGVKSEPQIMLGEASSQYKQLVAGNTLTVECLPGAGTTLYVKGKPEVGPYKEPAFFNAMAKIWLGKSPADYLLNDTLLGQAPRHQDN